MTLTRKPKAPKKKKKSLSSLPNEVLISILARISKSHYSSLCLVSKSFYSLLSSPDIYTARSEIGAIEPRLYFYLRLPESEKNHLFTLFDPVGGLLSLAPVRLSSSYAHPRLDSTSVAVGSKIYQIGGGKLSKSVRVLDCRSHSWRRAPRLTVARKNAKSCSLDGKIYVIGGREDESMISGEVFDIKTQIWTPLPSLVADSELQVVVLGGRVNVITKKNKYVYDTEQGRWLQDFCFVDIEFGIGPCCVIDDVMFGKIDGEFKWFNSMYGKWSVLENLDEVYKLLEMMIKFDDYYKTIQLVNHGGKLVIIWQIRKKPIMPLFGKEPYLSFQCVVIRLEKRLTRFETHIWGEVERFSFLFNVPKSYQLLSCLSVSL